jgi:hypothetical protein
MVVLAAWPDASTLGLIDDTPRVVALCVLPWIEDDTWVWVRAHDARDLLNAGVPSTYSNSLDRVVVQALRTLTIRVNLSSGLTHPSDRDAAIAAFEQLNRAGYRWSGVEIETWARANGWRATGATQLRGFAEGVAAGRRYRKKGRQPWRDDIVERWRDEADRDEPG